LHLLLGALGGCVGCSAAPLVPGQLGRHPRGNEGLQSAPGRDDEAPAVCVCLSKTTTTTRTMIATRATALEKCHVGQGRRKAQALGLTRIETTSFRSQQQQTKSCRQQHVLVQCRQHLAIGHAGPAAQVSPREGSRKVPRAPRTGHFRG
jgi:hypothetical protein